MADEIPLANSQVVRKSIFNMKSFYVFLHEAMTKALGYTFNEDDYAHWKKEYGEDIEFHWTFELNKDSYVKFRIWMECKIRGANKVKVKEGDATVSKHDAEVELNIKSVFIKDVSNWSKHPFLKHFKDFYERVIYKDTLEGYQARLWENMFWIQNEVKAWFDLPKFSV